MCRLHSFMQWPAEYCVWLVDIHLYEADTAPGKSITFAQSPPVCNSFTLHNCLPNLLVHKHPWVGQVLVSNLAAADISIASLQFSHCFVGTHASCLHCKQACYPRQAFFQV